jgi:hypothetical protein
MSLKRKSIAASLVMLGLIGAGLSVYADATRPYRNGPYGTSRSSG